MNKEDLIEAIDNILPQTQCGLCSYGGCKPYAEAIVNNNEQLDRCPPGGINTLVALGDLLNQDVNALIPSMEEKTKAPSYVVIRESECIGCTKCIQACPVDAIIGTAKRMHSVLTDECTGCDLCIEPCPVDCIDIIPLTPLPTNLQKIKSDHARDRFHQRNERLANLQNKTRTSSLSDVDLRKKMIEETLVRIKTKGGRE